MVDVAANFAGSVPEYYDSIMGPAQFEPFGADLVRRLPATLRGDVLEIACGTGLVTRLLRERLDGSTGLVATDISKAMLDYGRAKVPGAIEWAEADACKLPYPDERFAAVVCAFGIMFVPDKPRALEEARRVLRQGGMLLFNVWDGLENNVHGRVAARVMEARFPDDPAMKLGAMPYLHNDRVTLREMLRSSRFHARKMEEVRIACSAPSARLFATGQLRGTPRGRLLEQRGVPLDELIGEMAAELAKEGGAEPFRYTPQALVIEAVAV
ncbi:MAG TPA: methyltransferase domain-containing protein [Burkholderiales bacterium]